MGFTSVDSRCRTRGEEVLACRYGKRLRDIEGRTLSNRACCARAITVVDTKKAPQGAFHVPCYRVALKRLRSLQLFVRSGQRAPDIGAGGSGCGAGVAGLNLDAGCFQGRL